MVVILAAAYPGLQTPSLRLPYLYANSSDLQAKKAERGRNLSGASLQQIINYTDTFLSLRKCECQTMCERRRGGEGKKWGCLGSWRSQQQLYQLVCGETKRTALVQIITLAGRKKKNPWNLPITSVTINNPLFAMNLVQINRERGGRPAALHNLESVGRRRRSSAAPVHSLNRVCFSRQKAESWWVY